MNDTIRRHAFYTTDIDRPHVCGPACNYYPTDDPEWDGYGAKEEELDAKENAVGEVLANPNGDARAIALASLAAFLVAVLVAVMGSR